jgi:hypothetical protein
MSTAALVNSQGEIEVWMSLASDDLVDGSTYEGRTVKLIPEHIDIKEYRKTNYWNFTTSQWLTREQRPGNCYHWENQSWVLNREEFDLVLRAERNRRLTSSDWTQLSDNGLTTQQRDAWATYRQALRDLPAINEATIMESVVWPAQP